MAKSKKETRTAKPAASAAKRVVKKTAVAPAAGRSAAAARKKPAARAIAPEQRARMIAEAAYYLAERRGFQGGDPVQDWLCAEAEIEARLQQGA